ncbi:MAG TPA: hypothetical protein VFC78_23310 [Tepidisphaeraceae bacterium]|nr:hypothetical protein [Tepidisphaeraceae bacterium]
MERENTENRIAMNAVRIRKHLDRSIPELPDLAQLIGKNVETIVLEEAKPL